MSSRPGRPGSVSKFLSNQRRPNLPLHSMNSVTALDIKSSGVHSLSNETSNKYRDSYDC